MEFTGPGKLTGAFRVGRRARRVLVLLGASGVLALATFAVAAAPAGAYGKANWQVTVAGTGTNPGTGSGFGFWGWCDFAGGVVSGTSGDCQLAQYGHGPAGSGFTCHESIDITSWSGASGDFVINSGTIGVTPVSQTAPCLDFFPGPAGLPADTGIPSVAGHYNFGGIGGAVGEFQATVTQVP
jgi:hypothetical protein